jgi:hypothetical protein
MQSGFIRSSRAEESSSGDKSRKKEITGISPRKGWGALFTPARFPKRRRNLPRGAPGTGRLIHYIRNIGEKAGKMKRKVDIIYTVM